MGRYADPLARSRTRRPAPGDCCHRPPPRPGALERAHVHAVGLRRPDRLDPPGASRLSPTLREAHLVHAGRLPVGVSGPAYALGRPRARVGQAARPRAAQRPHRLGPARRARLLPPHAPARRRQPNPAADVPVSRRPPDLERAGGRGQAEQPDARRATSGSTSASRSATRARATTPTPSARPTTRRSPIGRAVVWSGSTARITTRRASRDTSRTDASGSRSPTTPGWRGTCSSGRRCAWFDAAPVGTDAHRDGPTDAARRAAAISSGRRSRPGC